MAGQQPEELLPDPELVGHTVHGFYTPEQLTNSLTWAYEEKRILLVEEVLSLKLNPDPYWWNDVADGVISDMRLNRDSYFGVFTPNQLQAMRQALNYNHHEFVEAYEQQGEDRWYNYTEGAWKKEVWCSLSKNKRGNRPQDDFKLDWKEVKGTDWLRRRWFLPDDFEQVTGIAAPNPEPVVLQWQRVGGLKHSRGALVLQMESDPNTILYAERARPPGVLPARPANNDPVGPGGYTRSPRGVNLNLHYLYAWMAI